MAADEERAERIRELKADRPGVTWRQIADYVGVSERAAQEWPKSGGIDHANAKKLAEFMDVDADWLWSGPKKETPSPFREPVDVAAELEQIHRKLDLLLLAAGISLPDGAPVAGPVPDRLPEAPRRHGAGRERAS